MNKSLLRCRLSPDDPRKLLAEEFEYIEYPMMLSQPEADPVELVRAALQEFVSRHDLAGDRVAVSAPGQAGLAKFIKLPPIEAKKIPDIVRYEANQQIPFPLDQVVWDWQRLAGGIEESGFVMDAEVALFAMKAHRVQFVRSILDFRGSAASHKEGQKNDRRLGQQSKESLRSRVQDHRGHTRAMAWGFGSSEPSHCR
jgi:type IV pilus assembly protein PilM